MFLTEAALPGVHPTASAIALTLWLIVVALVACAIASIAMVRAQPSRDTLENDRDPDEVEIDDNAA